MKEYVLKRTGDRPLKFNGELVAEVGGKWHAGVEQNRWHEIRVYMTASGKYVVEIAYETMWQGEDSCRYAMVCNAVRDVLEEIKLFDPLDRLLGYPPHPTFTEKQIRLEESLRQRWDVLVGEILSNIPDAAETVE